MSYGSSSGAPTLAFHGTARYRSRLRLRAQGHVPEPTLIVRLLDTVIVPFDALIMPVCFAVTGEVVKGNGELTNCPAGTTMLDGTLAPETVLERFTSKPPAGAGASRGT